MAQDWPILHYGVTRVSDGAGGSLALPDKSTEATVWVNAISQSEGKTSVVVLVDQPIRIGDFLRIPHEQYARS